MGKVLVALLSSWFDRSQFTARSKAHTVSSVVPDLMAVESNQVSPHAYSSLLSRTRVKGAATDSNHHKLHPARSLGLSLLMGLGLSFGISSNALAFNQEQEIVAQCNSGDLSSCNAAAQGYLEEKKFPEAVTYLDKLCYSQSPDALKACALEMTLLTEASYGINNVAEGIKVGEFLCQQQNAYGCLLLSNLYFYGTKVKQDLNTASSYAKQACQLQDATGCRQAALITFTAAYILKDVALAEESYNYHRAACDIGNQQSCNDLQQKDQKMEQFKLYAAAPASEEAPAPAPAQ